jgi:hypothetical protein
MRDMHPPLRRAHILNSYVLIHLVATLTFTGLAAARSLTSLTLVATDLAGTLAGRAGTLTITYGTVTPFATLDDLLTLIIPGMRGGGGYAMAARCSGCQSEDSHYC